MLRHLICAWILLTLVPAVRAVELTLPDAPPAGVFIIDRAGLLNSEDKEAVQSICSGLFTDKNLPVALISFDALADAHGAPTVEGLAPALLDHWSASDSAREWNRGAILLICKTDRKARLQMGATFQHAQDAPCQLIMDRIILTHFKAGDFSGGIRGGIGALAHLLRSGQLPPDAQLAEAQTPVAKPPDSSIGTLLYALAMIALMFVGAIVVLYLIVVFCFIVGSILKRRNWTSTSSSSTDSSSVSDTSNSSTSSSSSSSSDGGGASGSW